MKTWLDEWAKRKRQREVEADYRAQEAIRRSARPNRPNGEQEKARRRRQIAKGQLTVANGLVV